MATLAGTSNDDLITASTVSGGVIGVAVTTLADSLSGDGGADTLDGGGGSDTLLGGSGADLFVWSPSTVAQADRIQDFTIGQDRLDLSAFGIGSVDTLLRLADLSTDPASVLRINWQGVPNTLALTGVSVFDLEAADLVLSTAADNDSRTGTTLGEDLFGGLGNDTLAGDDGNDRLFGEQGADALRGDAGEDTLYGGTGGDSLAGGDAADALYGDAGADTLAGGEGSDALMGGAGTDVFVVHSAAVATFQLDQILDFNREEDRIDVSAWGVGTLAALRSVARGSDNAIFLNARFDDTDSLVSIGGVTFDELTADRIVFSTSTSTTPIAGSVRSDYLFGGLGADSIAGNAGLDRLFGEQGADTLSGGESDDTIDGGDGNDHLTGGVGNDLLVAGAGNDTLVAGEGIDTLVGGVGLDLFRPGLAAGSVAPDLVRDFTLAEDRIDLAAIGIASLGVARQVMADDAAGNAVLRVVRNGSEAGLQLQGVGVADLLATNFNFQARTSGATSIGGAQADDLFGALGNDSIGGAGGADRLFGDAGADTVDGGAGNDRLAGNDGADQLRGGLDADTLQGGLGADLLLGEGGNDSLEGGAGADTLDGGDGGNVLVGGAGFDVFRIRADSLGGGHQILDFRPGEDRLDLSGFGIGSLGTVQTLLLPDDFDPLSSVMYIQLSGGTNFQVRLSNVPAGSLTAADLVLSTVATNDTLTTTGNALLFGGLGNDRLTGQGDLFGEQGNDTLSGAVINASLFDGGDGADSIAHTGTTSFHRLSGGAGADTLQDGSARTYLFGGIGNDVLIGGAGNDTMDGGAGLDWASYANATAPVVVRLWSGFGSAGDALSDQLIGIENLLGSDYDDTLAGDAGANWLKGGFNFDSLSGGAGNDTIEGGERADTLRGGSGADVFRYAMLDDGPTGAFDTILDFVSGVDKIDLSALDANIGTVADDPFVFIGTAAFTGLGQLRRVGDLLVSDLNGDLTVDFQILLAPGTVFLATDLIA
jgi:Ca2+-binding RTX toxin-like protein